MALLNFPSNPNPGDQWTVGSTTYQWNGYAWVKLSTTGNVSAGNITAGTVTATSQVSVTTGTNSTSTTTGGLVVTGGAGVGGDLYVGGTGYISGAQIVTTATLGSFTVAETLVWTSTNTNRVLTGYRESGTTYPVRSAAFTDNLLTLTLASFTPSLSTSISPSSSLNWDQPVSSFTVQVDNPSDYTSEYISTASAITATAGSVGALSGFTASAKTATPAGGVDWNQTFTANGSKISPTSSSITGGSAAGYISFSYYNGSSTVPYTASSATYSVNWATPTMSVTLGSLTGQTFLGSYSSVGYTIAVTGITDASNYSHSVTSTGGGVSNSSGSGTLSFTVALHKDNGATTRLVTNASTFTRPATVTGSSYTAQITTSTSNASGAFTYPSLWIFTTSTSVAPVRSDIITGTTFKGAVTQLGDQVKTLADAINNPSADPQVLWFAVRSSASQPTSFRTGASSSLLSDVSVTTGNTVNLQPDSPLPGYTAEPYTLYGIILQSGSTYVSIG